MGHAAGDELLRQVADRLRGGARSHDVVARLAGDEFVVLLTDLPRSGAVEVAERFAERVQAALAAPFDLGGSQFSTSASIGVAVYPEHASDAREPGQGGRHEHVRQQARGRGAGLGGRQRAPTQPDARPVAVGNILDL